MYNKIGHNVRNCESNILKLGIISRLNLHVTNENIFKIGKGKKVWSHGEAGSGTTTGAKKVKVTDKRKRQNQSAE